jgi:hypothetical protein
MMPAVLMSILLASILVGTQCKANAIMPTFDEVAGEVRLLVPTGFRTLPFEFEVNSIPIEPGHAYRFSPGKHTARLIVFPPDLRRFQSFPSRQVFEQSARFHVIADQEFTYELCLVRPNIIAPQPFEIPLSPLGCTPRQSEFFRSMEFSNGLHHAVPFLNDRDLYAPSLPGKMSVTLPPRSMDPLALELAPGSVQNLELRWDNPDPLQPAWIHIDMPESTVKAVGWRGSFFLLSNGSTQRAFPVDFRRSSKHLAYELPEGAQMKLVMRHFEVEGEEPSFIPLVLRAGETLRVPMERIEVLDPVVNPESDSAKRVKGTFTVFNSKGQKLRFGERPLETNQGVVVPPGEYRVEVEVRTPIGGRQTKSYKLTLGGDAPNRAGCPDQILNFANE